MNFRASIAFWLLAVTHLIPQGVCIFTREFIGQLWRCKPRNHVLILFAVLALPIVVIPICINDVEKEWRQRRKK